MSKGPSILVVDEDPAIRLLLRRGLIAAGYRVRDAAPAQVGPGFLAKAEFDLVILDIDAAACGGTETIRNLRQHSAVPIVALSARQDERASVAALDSGADDYVRKPFGREELLARIRNALRRRAVEQGRPVLLISGDLEIDLVHRRVRRRGQEVKLSAKPYAVLRLLAENAGKVLTHAELLRAVWGERHTGRVQYLRLAIRTLRRQLETDPTHPRILITETRVGYRFVVHQASRASAGRGSTMSDRPEADQRPSPEALLRQLGSETRGRLKIFVGAAPGVGKTYEMLQTAQAKRREGCRCRGRRRRDARPQGNRGAA